MMPSRGLRTARGHAPRIFQQQCRNLSSRHPPSLAAPFSQSSLRTQRWRVAPPATAFSLSAVRHASTTPSSTLPPTTAPALPTPPPPAQFPNLDTITLDDLDLETLTGNVAESQIGYLHSLGIEYGYGMTSILQWIVEHAHVSLDLPWWGAIAVTAVATRILLAPLYVRSADMNARTQAMTSVTRPVSDRMTVAQKAGDTAGVMQAWAELRDIKKRAGLSTITVLTPMILQGYIGFCGFRLLRAMATLPVPGLHTGGFLWLQDLTISDGYLILPTAMAASLHLMVRWGGEGGATNAAVMPPQMRQFMLWGMPIIIWGVTAWQPGAIGIWFAVTTLWGMAQARLLQSSTVRNILGIAPVYVPTTAEGTPPNPFEMLSNQFNSKSSKVSSNTGAPATAGVLGGKNASYMKPTYQAPVIRRATSARAASFPPPTIIAKATSKPANPPSPSSTASKDAPGEILTSLRGKLKDRAADDAVAKSQARARASAQAYEKRYQEKEKIRKGR